MENKMLNPNMPTQKLLLHMGELTTNEMRVARAAITWANYMYDKPGCLSKTPDSDRQTMLKPQHIKD